MNIVVLDGKLLNPGDVDWGPVEALGNLKVYDNSSPEQVATASSEVFLAQPKPAARAITRARIRA